QRYPGDFDGIFARAPVINWTGLQTAGTRMGTTQMGAGWLSPAHVKLVHDAVIVQCDRLAGLAGRGSSATPSCLVDAQIDAVRTLHAPYVFDFALANGQRAYPGWGYGGEAAAGT